MKKRLFGAALAALALAAWAAAALSASAARRDAQDGETLVVATFYPMYVFAQNVASGVPGVRVVNMASQDAGCLHDYQLKTQDMALIEEADALVINGGGMERFLGKALSLRGDVPLVDASEGIEMLESGHHHEHGEAHGEEEEDETLNAHVWLDPALACRQVGNIADGLSRIDPENAARYQENARAYIQRLTALDGELRAALAPLRGKEIVTFHEAFDYFARAYGLTVAAVVQHEPGEAPGTRELAETCDTVRALGLSALFVEPQYPQGAAETVSRETGARVYTLDPAVSGDGKPDSYERIQRENARVLLEALCL